jgi:hypothetical protein
MRPPRLYIRNDEGEGTVAWPTEWEKHSSLLRADLLRDWIEALEEAYERARFQMPYGGSKGETIQ